MKPNNRMRKILPFLIFTALLSAREPFTYVYLLPFDNIQNDPAVGWIASGLSDMVLQELKNEYRISLKDKDDLEEIMNDRTLMLKQPRGSRNFLILGKFNRQLDKVHVTIQMVDIATWEEVDKKQVSEVYSHVPALNKAVGGAVRAMVTPFLPKKSKSNILLFPTLVEPKVEKKRHPVSVESEKVVSNLEHQISELESSMDKLLGARKHNNGGLRKNIPRYGDGEWTMDFSVDRKVDDNPENEINTQMLSMVLDQLLTNPYDVELLRPEFEYSEEDDLYMTVRFPIIYKLKEKIIKDMLASLPYTGLEQNGSLTIFYFDKNSFNFPKRQVEAISSGAYRTVPVIRIFDKDQNTLIVVADTPESYWHTRTSEKVLYVPQHQFSPLIDFEVGGWSLQVALETVEIEAVYEFTLPVTEVESLNNVSLKFINENELKSFLDPLL